MSYSNAYFRDDELEFPPPPLWLVWTSEDRYSHHLDPEVARARKGKGKIRHMNTLDKAKKRVSGYAVSKGQVEYLNGPYFQSSSPSGTEWMIGEWTEDWSIYEWTGEKYELRYSAKAGEFKENNPLFQMVVKKGTGEKVRTLPQSEVEAALESIRKAG